jgi:secreted trypsin-like serine protease
VGIVSAGTSECGIGAPAIFTRVTSYINWIIKTLNEQ